MARLGKSNALLEPLSEYLGDDFILESALVITVDGGTEGQNAHTDTEARQETFLVRSGVEGWMKQHNYQEADLAAQLPRIKDFIKAHNKNQWELSHLQFRCFLFQTRKSAAKFPCRFFFDSIFHYGHGRGQDLEKNSPWSWSHFPNFRNDESMARRSGEWHSYTVSADNDESMSSEVSLDIQAI